MTLRDEGAPLRFDRKAYLGSGLFFVYVATWYGIGRLFGLPARQTTFFLVAVTMSAPCICGRRSRRTARP
jgi:hypothetical protein